MEYRGIKFEVLQGSYSGIWTWSLLVGDPQMLRIGEAASEEAAVNRVKQVIDRALAVQASRQGRTDRSK